jgi:hypothetical protein
MMASFEALAAEVQRVSERTTRSCEFTGRGCRHRGFLTAPWAVRHALTCAHRPDVAADATRASVRVRVRAGGTVRLLLSVRGGVVLHGAGRVDASLSLIQPEERSAARVTLSTHRPLLGPAYGLQLHRAVHELSTAEAQASAEATRPKDVRILLLVEPAPGRRMCVRR